MNGFIKIDRKILEWQWYKKLKTFKLFFHLLLMANYRDSDYMGTTIKRGQIARSVETLSGETGLTVDEIRTAVKNLVKTGDLTCERHSKYTLFTVVNYDFYITDNNYFPNTSRTLPNHFPNTSRQINNINKNNKYNKYNKYNNTHEESGFDADEFFRIAVEHSHRKTALHKE